MLILALMGRCPPYLLSECPVCKQKQSIKNKKCRCGKDLDKVKRGGRVNYWIDYRYKDPRTGKLSRRRESVAAIENKG